MWRKFLHLTAAKFLAGLLACVAVVSSFQQARGARENKQMTRSMQLPYWAYFTWSLSVRLEKNTGQIN